MVATSACSESSDSGAEAEGEHAAAARSEVDPADLEDEDPVRAARHGSAERDRVHDAAVEEVLVADPGRGYRGQFSKRLVAEGFARTEMPCRAGGAEIESKGRILRFTRTAV